VENFWSLTWGLPRWHWSLSAPGSLCQHACRLYSAVKINHANFRTIEELVRNGTCDSGRMSHNINYPGREPGFLRDLGEHDTC
jgi:hypothetical protein